MSNMDFSALAKSYSALSYKNELRDLASAFFSTTRYESLSKYDLASLISQSIFENYEGEQILKYRLAKEFRKRNYIGAFEVKALKSRTDFLLINGNTKSFEIKSKIDTLGRLKNQTTNYADVFEFNTVVIDRKHLARVIDLVPEYYGVWWFEKNKKQVFRPATLSPNLDSSKQLGLFTKKELSNCFGLTCHHEIISEFSAAAINQNLKDTLKARYRDRWTFVKENWDCILPIDLQFFFNTNVSPSVVYGL